MAEYDLPSGPAELFETVLRPLGRAFAGEANIRFGGGTALAARWAHRQSTDVDLFVEHDRYRDFRWNTGGRFTLDLTAAAPVDRLVIDDAGAYISFHGRGGHVSVAPARGLPLDPRSPDTVRGTQVPFETTAEILSKKLLFRMARDGEILPRDLYDIAVARQRDPGDLHTALAALRNDELDKILAVFEDHAGAEASLEVSVVLRPADPALAEQAQAIVHRLIADERRSRPHGRDRGPGFEPAR